jgi:hypothetical protein
MQGRKPELVGAADGLSILATRPLTYLLVCGEREITVFLTPRSR